MLIADEPTTALDVTIQAQILNLLVDLQKNLNMAVMMITHDMGVVAETCQRVIVMYAGQVIEAAPVKDLFQNPAHPYTKALLSSVPVLGQPDRVLNTIEGSVPSIDEMPRGCRFHARCNMATNQCLVNEPQLESHSEGRWVRCWNKG
jgi:oligopeptide/dipeptide ABC transporter ATP-binding protein